MSNITSVIKKHIKNTDKKAQVKELTVFICNITNIVKKELSLTTNRVYITTKSLKHMYDKRTAQEFDFLMKNLSKIIKYPNCIYKNKNNKTGNFCFSKKFGEEIYFCIIEISDDTDPNDGKSGINYVVSGYKLNEDKKKRDRYLNSYKLLWSWKGD